MKDSFTTRESAAALGITPQSLGRKAKAESWPSIPRQGRGGGRLYPLTAFSVADQARLLLRYPPSLASIDPRGCHPTGIDIAPLPLPSSSGVLSSSGGDPTLSGRSLHGYDREPLWSVYGRATDKRKAVAEQRTDLLLEVMHLVGEGVRQRAAFRQVGTRHGVPWRNIENWYHGTRSHRGAKYYERGDWLAALLPRFLGRVVRKECHREAWDFFLSDYLRPEKPAISACYRRLKRVAIEHEWQIQSLRTMARRVKTDILMSVRVLKRHGEAGLMRLYPAQQRSVVDLHAMEWINGDGYEHNVFVRWPDGSIGRPRTWFWQDVYSRKLLAWRTDQTENTDMIRLAFGDLVEHLGVPEHATFDNTRGAANKWMTGGVANRYRFKIKQDDPVGLLPRLGVTVHWTSVHNGRGHGQAKPVERAFGVGGIGEVVDRHPAFAGAYTGNKPDAKPENYGSTAVPLQTFLQVLAAEVAAWNAETGRRSEICAGRLSFDQAFAGSYERSTIRKATEHQRALWLLSAEAIPVHCDGTVTLDAGSAADVGRNRYFAADLHDHVGSKVVVRYDPKDLHGQVLIYTLDGRHITRADCIDPVGYGDTEAARTHNRTRKQFFKATRDAANAEIKLSAHQVAALLPGVPGAQVPDAKVVRLFRPPTPKPREYTKEEQESHARLRREHYNPPPVVRKETDEERYDRWQALDRRVKAGEAVSEDDLRWHRNYQTLVEFTIVPRRRKDRADFEAYKLELRANAK